MVSHLKGCSEHPLSAAPLSRLDPYIGTSRCQRANSALTRLRNVLDGRRIVNVTGDDRHKGGVYEILRSTLPYLAGAGIDVSWIDVHTPTEVRASLEWAHVLGHGRPPDNSWEKSLGDHEKRMGDFSSSGSAELEDYLREHDIVVLHDTQTALLAPMAHRRAAAVVWHAHIGSSVRNAELDAYWNLFKTSLMATDACVFYLDSYIPDFLARKAVAMTPSVDPSLEKNRPLEVTTARHLLASEETSNVVERLTGRLEDIHGESLLATQVSRWDPLKGMSEVVGALGRVAISRPELHGLIVGPLAQSLSERRELALALEAHAGLEPFVQPRVHIWTVGYSGSQAHDQVIRAAQAAADVVIQNSMEEGFGLTVTEAMLKAKAVVARDVGGIRAQIEHGKTGLLFSESGGISHLAASVASLADDPSRRVTLGTAAAQSVLRHHVSDRHLRRIARYLVAFLEGSHARGGRSITATDLM